MSRLKYKLNHSCRLMPCIAASFWACYLLLPTVHMPASFTHTHTHDTNSKSRAIQRDTIR